MRSISKVFHSKVCTYTLYTPVYIYYYYFLFDENVRVRNISLALDDIVAGDLLPPFLFLSSFFLSLLLLGVFRSVLSASPSPPVSPSPSPLGGKIGSGKSEVSMTRGFLNTCHRVILSAGAPNTAIYYRYVYTCLIFIMYD